MDELKKGAAQVARAARVEELMTQALEESDLKTASVVAHYARSRGVEELVEVDTVDLEKTAGWFDRVGMDAAREVLTIRYRDWLSAKGDLFGALAKVCAAQPWPRHRVPVFRAKYTDALKDQHGVASMHQMTSEQLRAEAVALTERGLAQVLDVSTGPKSSEWAHAHERIEARLVEAGLSVEERVHFGRVIASDYGGVCLVDVPPRSTRALVALISGMTLEQLASWARSAMRVRAAS